MSKNVKTALTPRLRFPEFCGTDEWQKRKLSEISNRITEKVGSRELTTLSISAGVGFVSQTEKFSRDISGNQYANYICVKKGDFAYNKGNSKTFPQGCVYELNEFEKGAVPNAFLCFRFKNGYVSDFYKGYFYNNFHGKQLMRYITSGARSNGLLNINASYFFDIVLPTPKNVEEQQKIADCLTSLDNLIATENKKLEVLKTHKKGLMQKLFPAEDKSVPELRFPEFRNCGEWKESTVGQAIKTITDYVAAGSFADIRDKVNYLSTLDFAQLVRTVDIKNNFKNGSFVFVDESAFEFLRRVNLSTDAIIMPNIGANIGEVYLLLGSDLPFENSVLGPNAILLRSESNNMAYIFFLLCSDYFQESLKKIVGASGQPKFNKTDLKRISIRIAHLPEQRKIAECLSGIDEIITAQIEKIEALQLHKKGLIQGLFPTVQEVMK